MKHVSNILAISALLIFRSIYAQDTNFLPEQKHLFDVIRERSVPIQIYRPATEENHPPPLVIINHGYSVGSEEYTFIAEPLAKQGYFVVSIQHDLPDDPELPRTGNLYERRKPLWERGVQNILFVISELERAKIRVNLKKIILIGHSNGGDISMLFASNYPEMVEKVVSLDSLRMPFPIKYPIPMLTLRANDTKADEGVLPESGAIIINLENTKHIDMYDRGPDQVKKEIIAQINNFLLGSL